MKTALLVCAVFCTAYGGSELPPICPQKCQCRDNFTVIACSHRQLQRFPTPLPRSAQELDVSFNSIENVPTLVVTRLTKATFCHNHVRTIPRGTFAHATALRTLDFSHNCLVSLAADDLDGLEMLTDLDFSWNELRKLERYAFHRVPNLRTLKLSGNPLKFVDSSWFKNMDVLEMLELRAIDAYSLAADTFVLAPRLHTIDLSENDFTDVPRELESARNVRFLTMDQNPMVKLSKTSLSGVRNLEELHLSQMPRLEIVDKGSLWHMKRLTLVNMSNNVRLKEISDSALHWVKSPSMRLILTNNSLQSLDYAYSGLCDAGLLSLDGNPWMCDCQVLWMRRCNATQDLRRAMGKRMPPESWFLLLLIASATSEDAKDTCQVAGCACTVFDDVGEMFLQCANRSLLSLPELAHGVVGVDASHNMISELTKLPKLSLEVLDLHFNRISEIPAGVFAELSTLEMLDLSHNNIADVTPECFEGLARLTVLNLTENFLEVLHPKVFSATPLLKKLLLAGNNLKAIDSSWLASLPKLEHLDLRMLGLRSLPKDVFRDLPLLHLIELSQNEFEEVPTKALASAKSLKILHMEQNPIVTLTAESFADIVAIEELHLSAMPILETVEEGAFVGLQHLRILDLANNPKLSYIAVGALSIEPSNNTLKELYLSYANLTSLSFDGYEWCSVDVLDLRGNPWHCDCSLYWVKGCHFAPELTTKFLCNSPAALSGMPVMQLTDDDVECVQHSAAASGDGEGEHHHGHMTLRLLVVTAGLVTLLMVLAVALVAFRHRDIRDWFQDRKRIGAVYYVKANSGPSSRCSQV